MAKEILNIDYHVRRLVLKALNLKPNYIEAAKALGVSLRTVYRKMNQYNIRKVDGIHEINDRKKINRKNESQKLHN